MSKSAPEPPPRYSITIHKVCFLKKADLYFVTWLEAHEERTESSDKMSHKSSSDDSRSTCIGSVRRPVTRMGDAYVFDGYNLSGAFLNCLVNNSKRSTYIFVSLEREGATVYPLPSSSNIWYLSASFSPSASSLWTSKGCVLYCRDVFRGLGVGS